MLGPSEGRSRYLLWRLRPRIHGLSDHSLRGTNGLRLRLGIRVAADQCPHHSGGSCTLEWILKWWGPSGPLPVTQGFSSLVEHVERWRDPNPLVVRPSVRRGRRLNIAAQPQMQSQLEGHGPDPTTSGLPHPERSRPKQKSLPREEMRQAFQHNGTSPFRQASLGGVGRLHHEACGRRCIASTFEMIHQSSTVPTPYTALQLYRKCIPEISLRASKNARVVGGR